MIGVKEIAERAGVSMITVSRVINSPDKVAPSTRERIQSIMDELGYVHNTVAHNLASKKSGIICIYVSRKMGMTDPFFLNFLVGVSKQLSKKNYSIMIVDKINKSQFCDGYIFSGFDHSNNSLEECKTIGKPIVLFGTLYDDIVDTIDTDNLKGAESMVSHLIENGHRRIGIVINNVGADYVDNRLNGYKRALAKSGIPFDESIIFSADNSIQGGREAAAWYSSLTEKPSAMFFITDILAVGFTMASQSYNFNVPEEVSVAGFDGLGTQLISTPRITTLVQPVYDIACDLADRMIEKINNPNLPCLHRLVEGKILEEESIRKI